MAYQFVGVKADPLARKSLSEVKSQLAEITNIIDDLNTHLEDGTLHSKTARFVIGTSTSGWTAKHCDYLCDGTDDQEEINQAIQDLPASGGEIVILDGTYNITAAVYVNKSAVSIEGCGNATILKRMFESPSTIRRGVITLDKNSGCKISDLQIDGNKLNYVSVRNQNICVNASSNNVITGTVCNNSAANGFEIRGNSDNNIITGNTCNNNKYGISLFPSDSNVITGNTCNNNEYGIYVSISDNNTITGNTCNNNEYGIYVNSSNNNTITGNTCNNNEYGIYVNSSNNNTITGNTCIRGTGQTSDYTSSQYTIRLQGTNNYNLISSNNCMGKAVAIGGGTGNSVWGNKYDSGNDLPS